MSRAKRALITGVTGQDGSYLAELLLDHGYEVVGMVRRSSTVNFERIAHIQDRLTIVPGSRLSAALGEAQVRVNSLHHQGVDRLAPGLTISARAEDGLVEGVEMPGDGWVVAVQFHPEELFATQPYAARLFESFVAACARRVPTPVTA